MNFFLIIAALLFLQFPAFALENNKNDQTLFDAVKVYSEKTLILNDFLEFSEFDMSEIKFVNDTITVPVDSQGQTLPSASVQASSSLNGEAEIRELYVKLPQLFYTSLKSQIYYNRVPVTLYPNNSPEFAKPIKLYVKIKKIHLKPYEIQKDGTYLQPITLRIYGQLKDKANDEVILKYYDSASTQFVLGRGEAEKALKSMIRQMMQDLALHLKTKY